MAPHPGPPHPAHIRVSYSPEHMPAPHITHAPWGFCFLAPGLSLMLWEAAQSVCRCNPEVQDR